jgi:tetratricopeptide (TPR) repeat protein
MGSILVHEKEHAEALKHYREQLAIQRQLRNAHPGQAQAEITLSQSYLHLGNAQRLAGDAKGALQSLLESQRIIEPFAAADPNEVRSRTLLATARHRIAQARADLGETEEASRALRAVLEERRLLAERNPANAGARGEVAETLSALGDVAEKVKRHDDAARYYQGALDIFATLKKEGRSNFANEEEVQRINEQLAAIAKRKP